MDKFYVILIMVALFFQSCGIGVPQFSPLEERLLTIVEVMPAFGEELGASGNIVIKFSDQIDPLTVLPENIMVMRSEDLPVDLDDLKDEPLNFVPGTSALSENGDEVEYRPEFGFTTVGEYTIVVTEGLSSLQGMPLNSGKTKGAFTSDFIVKAGSGNDALEPGEELGGEDNPDNGIGETPPPPGPSFLIINEVLYDADGSDTNGDIFIELVGEPGGYLEGYYINLINGDDGKTYKTFSIAEGLYVPDDGIFLIADVNSSGNTNIDGADMLVNFDPQNGPDSVQLIGRDDELLDVLGYGAVPTAVAQNGYATYETAPAEDVSGGKSLSRGEGEEDTDNNGVDFTAREIPTPGEL